MTARTTLRRRSRLARKYAFCRAACGQFRLAPSFAPHAIILTREPLTLAAFRARMQAEFEVGRGSKHGVLLAP